MKTVTLLCRGESLKYINEVPQTNHCVIVNSFHYELEHEYVHEYVSNCDTVTHVLSLAAYFPKSGANKIYKKYNFDKIIAPYVKEVSPPLPNNLLNIEGINGILPVKHLDDINKKDMISHPRYAFTAPTCGLDALLYIVNELNPKVVNIIGLDFYDKVGYLTNSHGKDLNDAPTEKAIQRGEPTNKMKEFFLGFIQKNLDIQFNLYTLSHSQLISPNLKVKKK